MNVLRGRSRFVRLARLWSEVSRLCLKRLNSPLALMMAMVAAAAKMVAAAAKMVAAAKMAAAAPKLQCVVEIVIPMRLLQKVGVAFLPPENDLAGVSFTKTPLVEVSTIVLHQLFGGVGLTRMPTALSIEPSEAFLKFQIRSLKRFSRARRS